MSIRCRLPEPRARHGRVTVNNVSMLEPRLTARPDLSSLESRFRYFKVTPGDWLERADPAAVLGRGVN